MNIIKTILAAAALTIGMSVSASAMPVDRLGELIKAEGGVQTEQVRVVCNRWGRCWRTGGRSYRSYGYGYRRGWRHHRRR